MIFKPRSEDKRLASQCLRAMKNDPCPSTKTTIHARILKQKEPGSARRVKGNIQIKTGILGSIITMWAKSSSRIGER